MPKGMHAIYTQTVGAGGVGEITFNNIPQTYTDLKIMISARVANSAVANTIYMGINGSYATGNVSARYLAGDGGVVTTSAGSNPLIGDVSANSATANTFGIVETYIPYYAGGRWKGWISDSVSENNASGSGVAFQETWTGILRGGGPVTSLKFSASANFMQYSTFTIYGISR